MLFTSTRNSNLSIHFSQAVKDCIPSDGGVFVPSFSANEDLRKWIYYIDEKTTFKSIAGTLTSAFLNDEFSPIICETIATNAFPFEPKVTQLDDSLFHMELYNGFTGSYRDFGVSYLCSYLETTHAIYGGESVFLDYTTGELGALLAKTLKGKKHIKAVLVYKKGTVRGLNDSDFIWNGGNILPIEMEGTQEEIKSVVAQVFADKDFVKSHNLTIANTTNVCRLMAQVFYFPYAFAQIKHKVDGDIFYSIDSSNYSTLVSGLYSWRFALPLNGFYLPATSQLGVNEEGNAFVSNSIVDFKERDENNPIEPGNLERLESFFGKNEMMMRNFVFPSEISEKNREKAAKELYMKYKVYADKGTASAYAAIKQNQMEVYDEGGAFVLISQKHPSLDKDYCRHVIGKIPEMPENIASAIKPFNLNRKVISTKDELKEFIINNLK